MRLEDDMSDTRSAVNKDAAAAARAFWLWLALGSEQLALGATGEVVGGSALARM